MKTKNLNNKLKFEKSTLTELNDTQLQQVNGGILTTLIIIIGVPALGAITQITLSMIPRR